MMINSEDGPLAAEVPVADVVELQRPGALDVDDAGLDPEYVADRLQTDANTVVVIDQAIAVPFPDDEPDGDSD